MLLIFVWFLERGRWGAILVKLWPVFQYKTIRGGMPGSEILLPAHAMYMPPLTCRVCPVTYEAAGEHR
jgi:hypothetical protein